MKTQAIVVFIYGLLLLAGGIMGHVKAQSLPSLIMGSTFAVLTIISAVGMLKNYPYAYGCAAAISAILTLFFGYRFALSLKFMPAGLMAIISLLVLGYLVYSRKR